MSDASDPQLPILPADGPGSELLGRVFANLTNTYKCRWLLSLTDLAQKTVRGLDEGQELKARARGLILPACAVYYNMCEASCRSIEKFRVLYPKQDRLPRMCARRREILSLLKGDASAADLRECVLRMQCLKRADLRRECAVNLFVKTFGAMPDARMLSNLVSLCEELTADVKSLRIYVPYRFLEPWIGGSDAKAKVRIREVLRGRDEIYATLPYGVSEIQAAELSGIRPCAECAFDLTGIGALQCVELNPRFLRYVLSNLNIVTGFALHALTRQLEAYNGMLPALMSKLAAEDESERESLKRQHEYFRLYLSAKGELPDIYTDGIFTNFGSYALDHFMPWSFVHHNLIWNLAPIEKSLNSSKSDRLPADGDLANRLADLQQDVLRFHVKERPRLKNSASPLYQSFEKDFFILESREGPEELATLGRKEFRELMRSQLDTVLRAARRHGYQDWGFKAATRSAAKEAPRAAAQNTPADPATERTPGTAGSSAVAALSATVTGSAPA